jgi:hypothetical protein
VPGSFEDLELAGGRVAMGAVAVVDRDDPIMVASDQQTWNVVYEV